jgi:outer membrane protein, heavy metal efflux system
MVLTRTARWHASIRCGLVVALVVAPCFTRALIAQDRAGESLILGDLYSEVKRTSPRIQAAQATARAADARVAGARVPPDPQLQLGFMNYSLNGLRPMDPLGMTQLQVMQMIPVAGKLSLAGRVAHSQSDAAWSRAVSAEWEQRTKVAEVFYELYATDRQLVIAQETRRLLEDIASVTRSMYEVGEGRQTDVLRAQVEIARMTEDITRMGAMRTAAQGRLNALLNRLPESAVASPLLPQFPVDVPAIDSLQRVALAKQPMIRAGLQELDAAAGSVDLARREIWPDLQVGVQYGQRAGAMGTERMASFMIGASLPVFARSRQLRMRDEATAMQAMAAADLEAMRADTRGRIAQAFADLTRARNLSALYRRTIIPQAEATVNSALAAYRVGRVDFMTLLDDRMAVNQYRQQLATLDAEQGMAWADLEMLLGQELLDASEVAPPDGRDGGANQ